MRKLSIALAAALTLCAAAPAMAQVGVHIGPRGVYIGPHHRDYDNYYNSYSGCRVVITHHTNRFGEDVTVRRRICD